MNCKPGDMAQVVRALDPIFGDKSACTKKWYGLTIQVLQPIFGQTPGPAGILVPMVGWTFEGVGKRICPHCGKPMGFIPDEILKPLPPPEDVEAHDKKADLGDVAERERMLNSIVRIEAPTSWYDTLLGDER